MDPRTAAHMLDGSRPGQPFGNGFRVDTIHHTPHDRLVFRPESYGSHRGLYVMQMGERVTAGTYEGAQPHIGEAIFTRRWESTYHGVTAASAAAWHVCGLLGHGRDGFDILAALAPEAAAVTTLDEE